MGDIAIRVKGVGKQYRLGRSQERYVTLRDQIGKWTAGPLRALLRGAPRAEQPQFWALKDVSLEVGRGEVVGIIGRNGAGKSTLLKILSRITEPTEGQVDIHGRVGSLLEVGTGFHPELTGRENLYLNGAILGMRRSEIARKFDEIVAFAEIEKFIDTPVKHYSSGMYMRLAFAVAAHLDPEILIVDEVLAVGDAEFQKKCLGKMGDVARGGRTVLFVSHNLPAITSLCSRAVLLQGGQVVHDGPTTASVARYLELSARSLQGTAAEARPGSGEWRYTSAAAIKEMVDPGEAIEVSFRVAPKHAGAGKAYLSGLLCNEAGTVLTQVDSRNIGVWLSRGPIEGQLRIAGIWLKPGRYTVDLYICTHYAIMDVFERAAEFEVSTALPYPHASPADATLQALVLSEYSWRLDP